MRILLANSFHFYGGGDSTYTFNLANLLRSKGHRVAFFAMQDERNISDSNSDLFVSHIDFKELDRNKNLLAGLRVMRRVIYSTEARKKFSQMLERLHPDIIHLQNIHAHITPSVIFEAKKRGLPVVWTLHDYKLICPNTHFLIDKKGEICEACSRNHYYQAVLKRCKKDSLLASAMASVEAYAHRIMGLRNIIDFFITPSAFLRSKLIDRGFPPEKVKHLPLFLTEDVFHDVNEDKGYLLFFGKLDPIKGIYPLLEACQKAKKIHLSLAGRAEEPLTSRLQEILLPNTKYVGMKYGDELRNLILGARAVILPSLWYENQTFSIIEAFAAGKPVIASDLGGMTELVKNSKGGLLVPPGDVEALAEAMEWIATHAKQANQMGQAAREYAMREHSSQKHYERLMHIYERVLN
jgi:glycosyltransferase involved in cell wall biosynthesis